jgi:DNA-binding transcriptional LysR family regulator
MRLDIDSLRTFMTVLDLGGVTRAAQKLHLTQSAVSHKLARLEEKIGRPVLVKIGGAFMPTADGRRLLSYAERLIALHDEAADHFRSSDIAGEVRLGASEDATGSKLAAVLGRFRRLHPRVSLAIRVAQSLVLQQRLQAAELDVTVMQIFVQEKAADDLELWREDLVWVQAADHPIAAGSTIPFVSFDENCFYRQAAQQALAGSGRKLDVVLECPSAEGVKAGVRHGLGIGLIGRRILSEGLSVITADLPAFPQVCHVLRWRVGLPSDLQKSLTDAVLHEMLEPGSEFTSVAA